METIMNMRHLYNRPEICLLRYLCVTVLMVMGMLMVLTTSAHAAARLKDIVTVEGIRDNVLVGYGLVVGLDGSGDKLQNTPFTEKSLRAFLGRLGVNTEGLNLKAKNVATVTVTATLPPFARIGSRIDLTVSTMGDATSLEGGTLIVTPLMGGDEKIYAVAQGPISLGGIETERSGETTAVPTRGYIPAGAIVEREIDFELNELDELDLALRNPDITTAREIASVINRELTTGAASVLDPGTVLVKVPNSYIGKVAMLLAAIEQLEVEPDQSAKILIDENSGTIVMNENVKIDTVAVAQGNLVVQIYGADATISPTGQVIRETEPGEGFFMLEETATLHELVDGLNMMGVGPRDMISLLQNIRAAGALQAEIEAR